MTSSTALLSRRQLLHAHRQSLLESLRADPEPAMTLHLVAVLLFQQHTGLVLHVTGRLVPLVVSFLSAHMSPGGHAQLTRYQELVVRQLRTQEPEEELGALTAELKLLVDKMKTAAADNK